MSNSKKFWMGFLAFAPIPLMIGYFYSFFQMFTKNLQNLDQAGGEMPAEFIQNFGAMFIWIGIASIISIIGIVVYILDIVKNPKFQGDNSSMKVVWILLTILLSTIGMIIYFFVEVVSRKNNDGQHPLTPHG